MDPIHTRSNCRQKPILKFSPQHMLEPPKGVCLDYTASLPRTTAPAAYVTSLGPPREVWPVTLWWACLSTFNSIFVNDVKHVVCNTRDRKKMRQMHNRLCLCRICHSKPMLNFTCLTAFNLIFPKRR